ncbi:MAG: 2-dehydro-3-deoxyphosphogluconate aldolase [Conexibacter sp.]|jgi:2-dehydro-3-deoxyphosphogluconate aldolase/(4S)-4-hydroxy-2-oxoglutarate aldolase|nr:2-dehydro-3-deoxyphosphogluconate aldolase [Conexibacter sp.]MDX6716855.1 2-dehydro-3-deoxyphosphogluconate aldolase / (4S)-4-hydroxy-2-oxoglutarate aldolase [Baekduia sp.]
MAFHFSAVLASVDLVSSTSDQRPPEPVDDGRQQDTLGRLGDHGVLPVVEVDTVEAAKRLLDALTAGGLPTAEITLRTAAGVEAIGALRTSHPDALIGAGTVRSVGDAQRVIDAGAQFVVSAVTDPDVIALCHTAGVLVVPGACTPNELAAAGRAGASVVKFFPAEAMGGTGFLEALAGPFPDVRFLPSGGVSPSNVAAYLRLPQVVACGASWMVRRELMAAQRFDRIEELAREAVALVAEVRAGG